MKYRNSSNKKSLLPRLIEPLVILSMAITLPVLAYNNHKDTIDKFYFSMPIHCPCDPLKSPEENSAWPNSVYLPSQSPEVKIDYKNDTRKF